jgi:cation-transporting ATPase 13A1
VLLMRGAHPAPGRAAGSKILHAHERVTVDNAEAYAFMLILVVIACAASFYVLWVGMEDEKRSRWKLFLHCVMIVTSVVPPELPMELSLAVTTSLSSLIKHQIFCTEPYRIPLAGAIDVCCFDKTGTLTSDELSVLGVFGVGGGDEGEDDGSGNLLSMQVMGACHELVTINHRVQGSPTELAMLKRSGFSL